MEFNFLGLNPNFATCQLCKLRQVPSPLCAFVSSCCINLWYMLKKCYWYGKWCWKCSFLINSSFISTVSYFSGLPRWCSGKESTCHCWRHRRPGFNPWVRKICICQTRKQQPALVFLPGKFCGQRSLADYSPQGCKESDTTDHTHTHASFQYSKTEVFKL